MVQNKPPSLAESKDSSSIAFAGIRKYTIGLHQESRGWSPAMISIQWKAAILKIVDLTTSASHAEALILNKWFS